MNRYISSFWPMSWFHGMAKIDVAEDGGILWDGDVDLTKSPTSLCELIGTCVIETTGSEMFADKVVRTLAKMLNIEDKLHETRLSQYDVMSYKQVMRDAILDNASELALSWYFLDVYSDKLPDDDLVDDVVHFI